MSTWHRVHHFPSLSIQCYPFGPAHGLSMVIGADRSSRLLCRDVAADIPVRPRGRCQSTRRSQTKQSAGLARMFAHVPAQRSHATLVACITPRSPRVSRHAARRPRVELDITGLHLGVFSSLGAPCINRLPSVVSASRRKES